MINLFATPVYFENINIEKKDIDILIKEKYEKLRPNNGLITLNKYVLNNKKLNSLKKEITKHLYQYVYNQLKIQKNTKFKMLNSWCIKHRTEDWSHKHDHENSLISGILYLKTYPDSGDLVLHRNKLLNLFPNTVKLYYEEYDTNNCEFFSIRPKEGDLIFFPSSLEHSVTKNLNKNDRYSCAFNFFPSGKLGNDVDLNWIQL